MQSLPRSVRSYGLFFIIYTVIMAVYLWFNAATSIPAAYIGTAADPATFLSAEQLKQSEVYSALRNGLYMLSFPLEWGIYLVVLLCGFAKRWQQRLESSKVPAWLRFPIFLLILNLVSFVTFLPLRIVSYMLSRGYGISTQGLGSWIQDKAISFGIGYITMLIAVGVALWMIGRGGRWWLRLWLLSIPFIFLMMYIQPVVIDPLYNQFTRLSDPKLEQQILNLADRANIPAHRVYEVNMSEKTNSLNAYVNGFGNSLRIVLWDTTLKRLDQPEILLIMAHEMGHYVMHHLEWSAVGAVFSSLLMLWIGSLVYRYVSKRWGRDWGIRKANDLTAVPALLLILSIISFAASPFANAVSRHAEHAADEYALNLIGSNKGAVTMYQKLAASSLSDVNPPWLIKMFRSSHPSIFERIVYVESYTPSNK